MANTYATLQGNYFTDAELLDVLDVARVALADEEAREIVRRVTGMDGATLRALLYTLRLAIRDIENQEVV